MPSSRLAACLAALTLSVSAPTHAAAAAPLPAVALQPGDLVFQASRSRQAAGIRLATGSRWSHVAIVERAGHGATVLEAIEPVSRTSWERWRRRGIGEVLVLRVRGLDPAAKARAVAEARRFLGKPYDARFGWGDDRLYCSELVVKAYERGAGLVLGRRQKLGELAIAPVKGAIRERWGKVPDDLELVTPASIADDPRLEVVYRGP
ncbi:MAG: YiiX/YebB-like N1pC/P60 family cysteine hydrolase [Anaeromyxobacter sp.]